MTPPLPVGRARDLRLDIEGLRAIAVGFVLIHHAGTSLLPGGFAGVDLFFVVSGFVITTRLVQEVEQTGTVNLRGFYARRAKRLLPAAALVLVATAIATRLFASRVYWSVFGTDVTASAAYVVNWVFASRSVDYLAEDVPASPLQHFWSLAVEEQFYFIWPVLIIGLATLGVPLARRMRPTGPVALRQTLAAGLLVIVAVPSFVWSVYYTSASPNEAYFVTTTRLWELSAGALVAVAAPLWQRLAPKAAAWVAWLGMALLLGGVSLIDTSTPWPGSAAAIPVLATSMVIAGGFAAGEFGPVRVLRWRPLVWIGGLSYSLYLWHWPMLRVAEWEFGDLAVWQGLVIVVASVVPAWLGYRLVEQPIRYSSALSASPRLALSAGANFTFIGVVAGLLLSAAATASVGSFGASADAFGLGRGPDDTPLFPTITPDPALATSDVSPASQRGCQVPFGESAVLACPSPVAATGAVHIVVAGDSKILQWVPALERIAAFQGWRLTSYTKSGCSYTEAVVVNEDGEYDECRDWGEELTEILLADPPSVLVTSGLVSRGRSAGGVTSRQAAVDGYTQLWARLNESDIAVVAISDTPQPSGDAGPAYECVAEHSDDPNGECSWGSTGGAGSTTLRDAAAAVEGATYIDMNQYVCPDRRCPAVYRNILTYRQGSHITNTYVSLLTGPLRSKLVPIIESALNR